MMSKTAAEPLVRISKREGTTFVQKVLVRAIAILPLRCAFGTSAAKARC